MQRQLDLFAAGARPAFDAQLGARRRIELAYGAWLDYVPGWVTGHDALFDELRAALTWRAETMQMYDREVAVPRLLAGFEPPHELVASPGSAGAGSAAGGRCGVLIEAMRTTLSAHYREDFVRVSAALYRDGRDSVAMHGDTTARDMIEATVATLSLGEPRRFVLRPAQPQAADERERTVTMTLGRGDLLVMGGTCQRTWRHGIPKVASAGPRMAVMFRPAWYA